MLFCYNIWFSEVPLNGLFPDLFHISADSSIGSQLFGEDFQVTSLGCLGC